MSIRSSTDTMEDDSSSQANGAELMTGNSSHSITSIRRAAYRSGRSRAIGRRALELDLAALDREMSEKEPFPMAAKRASMEKNARRLELALERRAANSRANKSMEDSQISQPDNNGQHTLRRSFRGREYAAQEDMWAM